MDDGCAGCLLQMVRDAFDLAKEKCKDRNGAIIFIDEVRIAVWAR